VLLVAGGAGYWFLVRPGDNAEAATATSQTQWVTASTTTLEKSVSASGTITPKVQEDVDFAASGTVTAVNVKAGDTVTAGQVLATIDTLSLNADLLSAKATLATAQAKLDTDTDNDASDEQLAADQASIDVAQAMVDDATTAMGDATLTAPVAGIVTSTTTSPSGRR